MAVCAASQARDRGAFSWGGESSCDPIPASPLRNRDRESKGNNIICRSKYMLAPNRKIGHCLALRLVYYSLLNVCLHGKIDRKTKTTRMTLPSPQRRSVFPHTVPCCRNIEGNKTTIPTAMTKVSTPLIIVFYLCLGVLLLASNANLASAVWEIETMSHPIFAIPNENDPGGRLLKADGSPRILVYMTTIFSHAHKDFFTCCWPRLMKQSRLLQEADIMIFSNNNTEIRSSNLAVVRSLFQSNNRHFEIKFPTPEELNKEVTQHYKTKDNSFQMGANLAIKLGFSNGWFAPYDWIVRINPDVLIRNSRWLMETMHDPDVDGIFVNCMSSLEEKIHTDFFAVRPRAMRPDAFSEMAYRGKILNHEMTAYKEFAPILQNKNRFRFLPDTADSKGVCRVRGPESPVYHDHDSCHYDVEMRCNSIDSYEKLGHVIE
jgi:hypothetical protein